MPTGQATKPTVMGRVLAHGGTRWPTRYILRRVLLDMFDGAVAAPDILTPCFLTGTEARGPDYLTVHEGRRKNWGGWWCKR